ncbi:MAG: HAMP domain-containing histidine kinase [Bacteroidales bacterium]|nr:HAMP domain-containing histidine kinase [Bacteroidales bacterium]
MFSVISHELRNPLFWFRNLIQMLSDNIDKLDKAMLKKSVASLNESATNTFHLMDNLLQWSTTQLGKVNLKTEKVEVGELVAESLKLVKPIAGYKQLVIDYVPNGKVHARADKNMAQTIVRNIISNAVKFTPEQGRVSIQVSKTMAWYR